MHEADAAALPLADASFDLVVAFMSLHDVDDLAGAAAEAGRVLEPRGRLCIAVVHPLASSGRFAGEDAAAPFVIEGSYLALHTYADEVERDGLRMAFVSAHRPLAVYVDALAAAGFVVELLREPEVPEHGLRFPRSRRWQGIPNLLHLRALLMS